MLANGVSRGYSVHVSKKSVLNLKQLLFVKIVLLFFCHELSICFLSESFNFTITEQFLEIKLSG